jgi:hypothetical protein
MLHARDLRQNRIAFLAAPAVQRHDVLQQLIGRERHAGALGEAIDLNVQSGAQTLCELAGVIQLGHDHGFLVLQKLADGVFRQRVHQQDVKLRRVESLLRGDVDRFLHGTFRSSPR